MSSTNSPCKRATGSVRRKDRMGDAPRDSLSSCAPPPQRCLHCQEKTATWQCASCDVNHMFYCDGCLKVFHLHSNDQKHAALPYPSRESQKENAAAVDAANDSRAPLEFVVADDENRVVQPLPADADSIWVPGRDLLIAYVTWNMAQQAPTEDDIVRLARPTAHIICVATQENGAYVGSNKVHEEWECSVQRALGPNYVVLKSISMMALHLMVACRQFDVYSHIVGVHASSTKTGMIGGAVGNKGGLGIALTLSLKNRLSPGQSLRDAPSTQPHETQLERVPSLQGVDPDESSRGASSNSSSKGSPTAFRKDESTPAEEACDASPANTGPTVASPAVVEGDGASMHQFTEISMLFVGAHLTAHQHNVLKRDEDYQAIVRELSVGSKGPYAKYARKSAASCTDRDATEEYDICFFGGDLNYRIIGTKGGIESIIDHHVGLRAVLAANDQLTIEKQRGRIFHHFSEGPLMFRPTYKYHIDPQTGRSTDKYDQGAHARMPAFCDRVLYKKHPFFPYPLQLEYYSDIRDVRSSDHRPVCALFRLATPVPPPVCFDNDTEVGEAGHTPWGCCSGCCVS